MQTVLSSNDVDLHRESKRAPPYRGYNFVNSRSIFKTLSLLQRVLNFQQTPY